MPREQEDFQNAVFQILEAVMFENWLRFYFIVEKSPPIADAGEDRALFLAVPEKGMERIRKDYPHLLPIVAAMNGQELSFTISRQAVCKFVVEHLDGKTMPRNAAAIVLDSQAFQTQMQLFHAWVQLHEQQLEENFLSFEDWRRIFLQWRESPGARELSEKLILSA